MKLERVIEVYPKKEEGHEDDWPDEIYDLTESQVDRLKPFLKEPVHTDFENNLYSLECYEDNT